MADSDRLEAIARLPTVAHPTPSPDGDTLAFYWDESGRNELYLRDLDTGAVTRISDGEVPRDATMPLFWAGDGERVFYHRDDGGDEQYDLYAADRDGDHEPVVELDGQNRVVDTGPDGRVLLFLSTAPGQLNLHRYDAETGAVDQLTDREVPVYDGGLSPDGDRVAYFTPDPENLDNYRAWVADADGSDARELAFGTDDSESAVVDWHPDGDRLLVGDDESGVHRIGVYDLADDAVRWLSPGDHPESADAFTPDGSRVVGTRNRDAATVPVVYDVADGTGRELDLPLGFTHPVSMGSTADPFVDDALVLRHETAADRPAVLRYDLSTDESETLHEPEYGDFEPDDFVDAEYVTFDSEDGLEVGGLLYDSGERPSPGVVEVHGGPHFQSQRRFNVHVQFLVSEGYTVLRPNYRGSTGRGREFKRAIRGDWGGKEQADIAAAGRWLKARDWVDADRVAVMGGSYGGYAAYCQLVQYPTLWAAAVPWVGITDLHALYEEDMPHFKTTLRQQMGDPEANHDLWRERSPVEHVGNVERPFCVVHGVNDPRCPVSQARLFRDAVEDELGWTAGREFAYHELDEEGHGSSDQDQKVRTFRHIADFLDERV
ncbi:S9 family peptidase [Halostella salina]|uniref:S9 family peptidase n=1 Tax=Halostella salina TaxID=1547897 RepID=UPI000EF7F505|nr:prolyl oligopeptidase family serine peptidase [Halostella salina]